MCRAKYTILLLNIMNLVEHYLSGCFSNSYLNTSMYSGVVGIFLIISPRARDKQPTPHFPFHFHIVKKLRVRFYNHIILLWQYSTHS